MRAESKALRHQDVHLTEGKWTINVKVEGAGGNGGAGEDGGTLWRRRCTGDRLVTTGRTWVDKGDSVVNGPWMVRRQCCLIECILTITTMAWTTRRAWLIASDTYTSNTSSVSPIARAALSLRRHDSRGYSIYYIVIIIIDTLQYRRRHSNTDKRGETVSTDGQLRYVLIAR